MLFREYLHSRVLFTYSKSELGNNPHTLVLIILRINFRLENNTVLLKRIEKHNTVRTSNKIGLLRGSDREDFFADAFVDPCVALEPLSSDSNDCPFCVWRLRSQSSAFWYPTHFQFKRQFFGFPGSRSTVWHLTTQCVSKIKHLRVSSCQLFYSFVCTEISSYGR